MNLFLKWVLEKLKKVLACISRWIEQRKNVAFTADTKMRCLDSPLHSSPLPSPLFKKPYIVKEDLGLFNSIL
ncbi:hypothetical protein CR513_59377, partial [Mucuna pruriens]